VLIIFLGFFIDTLGQIRYGVAIIKLWVATMLLVESMHCPQGNVEVIWATPVAHVRSLKHSVGWAVNWTQIAMCEAIKFGESRDFDVLNKTLSLVGWPLSRVEIDLERKGFTSVNNFNGLATVDLRLKSFNFLESYVITILIAVAFVLVDHYSGFLFIADRYDHEWFGVLTIVVKDLMVLTIVNKCVAE